uniref:AlNc14C27G2663 protein n=1 Tax=Albugo laibachii Nc14 TaxID=890382 RepID=F0W734_9STRA|nr:AlNc14C27G2663 [Albugo laibachii Nc14]|eukprot:CCA16933.1 AlNc14C27G2663 [Albugo laibachii Nc14]
MFQGMLTLIEQQKEMIMELRKNHQTKTLKIVGVKMPTYFGHLNESLESFFFQVRKYCQGQGIDMDASEHQDQVIAFIAVNLRGAAAAWYQQVVMQGVYQIASVEYMKEVMKLEFVPVDKQERL